MRKFIIILLTIAVLSSCTKAWEWGGPALAVNNTEIKVPLTLAGHFYVPIFSSVQWNISFEYPEGTASEWLHPDITSGCGYNVCVKIEYDANPSTNERQATMVITPEDTSTGAETLKILLTQGGNK